MREYTGPLPSKPTLPVSSERPKPRRGWMELDERSPCSECGELLIAPYSTIVTLGGKEKMQLGPPLCRTGCDQLTP